MAEEKSKLISQEELKDSFAELLRACGYDVIVVNGDDLKKKDKSK